ncbi:P-loop containing nucleoside triphosphate hydrolase protein [Pilobolus umbonatus]|nr:P-loop containing nucleoside triphosphate hydrolase protein [Pilobolus umbonatus]
MSASGEYKQPHSEYDQFPNSPYDYTQCEYPPTLYTLDSQYAPYPTNKASVSDNTQKRLSMPTFTLPVGIQVNAPTTYNHVKEYDAPTTTTHQYHTLSGLDPLPPSLETETLFVGEPDADPMQHFVLLPLGKTGAGKSSLLNTIFEYDEFIAKPTAMSVTDKITERTGIWTVDQVESIVTVADTPGFADSKLRDEKFKDDFKIYISDLGSRLGIDSFLLIFQCTSPIRSIMASLESFKQMMENFGNKTWWKYVLLVFTRVDYHPLPSTKLINAKQTIIDKVIPEIQKTYELEAPPKYAFISSKKNRCSSDILNYCDCRKASEYHLNKKIILKAKIISITKENGGRWKPQFVPTA